MIHNEPNLATMARMADNSIDAIVTDPFCGSGTTLMGAKLEGFAWVGSEMDPEYAEIARKRVEAVHFMRQMGMFE